jgi:hypothetical protein
MWHSTLLDASWIEILVVFCMSLWVDLLSFMYMLLESLDAIWLSCR